MKPKKPMTAIMLLIAFAVVIGAPFFGPSTITLRDVFSPESILYKIFWEMRLPRVLVGFLVGAALAMSGMSFQAIFRNPLATPFILGISAGASLGASVYIFLESDFPILLSFGFTGKMSAAFLGAVCAICLVYALTRLKKGFTSSTLLLAGVSVSFFFSSVILFIQCIANETSALVILHWLMGDLKEARYGYVFYILPFVAGGAFLLFYLRYELNLMLTGEDIAASRGVDVKKTKLLIFFAMSLVVGAVVAVCGPIGFVGMMIPHICRLMIGADHKRLIPVCILFGGSFLVLCDVFARLPSEGIEIPVAVITALIGGPFFIYLLIRRQSEKSIF